MRLSNRSVLLSVCLGGLCGTYSRVAAAQGEPEPVEPPEAAAPTEPAAPEPPAAEPPAPEPPAAEPEPPASAQPAEPKAPPAAAPPADEASVEAAELEEFEATAEVEAPPREAVKRSVKEEELTRIPGTRGDALRAIEVLPGVARTPADDAMPILRGAGSDESQTFLDGMPVPFLYHFGGLTSFYSSRLLSRVDLYPGNFSPRFGRVVGGTIDVRTRDPRKDRFHGALDLSLVDMSFFAEAPLGENTGFAVAGRRSNIDFVYSKVVPDDLFEVVSAPVYYDYQAIFTQRIAKKHQLRLLGYGSSDRVELVFSDPVDDDPGLTGAVGGAVSFHRVQAELRSEFSPQVQQDLTVTFGRLDAETRFGEVAQIFGGEELHGRAEWSFELHPSLRVMVGGDFYGQFLTGEYRGPKPTQFEGNPRDGDPLAAQRIVSVESQPLQVVRPGLYLEAGYRPFKGVLLSPGVRADYYGDFDAWSVDPRLSTRVELSESTALKAGVGRYSQPPLFWMSVPEVGNPDLGPYSALQTSLGLEQSFGTKAKLGVEGFYKYLENTIVGTEDGGPPTWINDGTGRIYGAEFSAELRPDERTFAFIAYTLSRSERSDHGGPYRLFDHDQTHILSVVGSRKLGAGWELGARFRLVSGEPTTPVTGSVFDTRSGVYLPIYGEVNSVRDPLFNQLDVRIEKAWRFGDFSLATYLDVQNVYNAQNPDGRAYNYDYTAREDVSGMSFFPNIGVRGEL